MWTAPPSLEPAEPTDVPGGETAPNKPPQFNRAARAALERLRVALGEAATHIGTEHLHAALVWGGPPDVVACLGALGATADAVDELLARLAGRPGTEGPPEDPRAVNGAGSALTYTRLTVDARAVVRQGAALGRAAGRTNGTPVDLATTLALYDGGNVVRVWTEAPVPPPPPAGRINHVAALAGLAEQVLGMAATIARVAGASQVGTEHLLVALIRNDHPEVVTLLARRGGTPEAAAALLAELAGDPGVEVPAPAARRPWWRAIPRWQVNAALTSLAVVLVMVVYVLGSVFGP